MQFLDFILAALETVQMLHFPGVYLESMIHLLILFLIVFLWHRISEENLTDIICKEAFFFKVTNISFSLLEHPDAPTCKPNQTRIYGVAKLEKVNISCEVEANPADVVFKWSFNNSQESVDVLPNHITKSGTSSIVSHVPATDMDYGTLLCSASNKVGQQRTPCMYHIVAAGEKFVYDSPV